VASGEMSYFVMEREGVRKGREKPKAIMSGRARWRKVVECEVPGRRRGRRSMVLIMLVVTDGGKDEKTAFVESFQKKDIQVEFYAKLSGVIVLEASGVKQQFAMMSTYGGCKDFFPKTPN
jgi:hypothetical protein